MGEKKEMILRNAKKHVKNKKKHKNINVKVFSLPKLILKEVGHAIKLVIINVPEKEKKEMILRNAKKHVKNKKKHKNINVKASSLKPVLVENAEEGTVVLLVEEEEVVEKEFAQLVAVKQTEDVDNLLTETNNQ